MPKSNATPAATTLPSYILERNECALGAGLEIEKQRCDRNKLSTVYRGLPQQFATSGFMRDPAEFLNAVAAPTKKIYSKMCRTQIYSPLLEYVQTCFYRTKSAHLRMTITHERLPSKEWKHAPGVDAYETFADHELGGLVHVFIAKNSKVLIDAGFNEKIFTRKYYNEGLDFKHPEFSVWRWNKDEIMRIIRLETYPENIVLLEQAKADGHLSNYKTPEEYRDGMLSNFDFYERILAADTKTTAGFSYSMSDEDRGEIGRLLSEAKSIVMHARIQVSKAPPRSTARKMLSDRIKSFEARCKAGSSRADSVFQKFLLQVIAKPQENEAP
jgi:hypothetical protein